MIGKLEAQTRRPIGKYSFANRTTQLWNQLPPDDLETLYCKPRNFRKKLKKVIDKLK
jgi:hypothetical protein